MHGSYNTVEQPLQRTEAKIVKVEFYHYSPLKSFNMKVNNDAQSCPTRSDPMERSLPDSSIHGIFQARVLEWVATAFSE